MKLFLLGVVFSKFASPVIDQLTEVACSALETVNVYFQEKVLKKGVTMAKLQKEIHEVAGECECHAGEETRVIGFSIDTNEEEEDEE